MRALILFLFLICTCNLAQANEFFAKVIAVMDGDTVLVRRASGLVKIRLAEIDAPEKAQAFGKDSTRTLSEMVLGKRIKVISQAIDRYGRTVAHLSLNGLDVNVEQIRRGMAWEYSYFHSNHALISLQKKAMKASLGLWAQAEPTPPWQWRKQHPNTYSAKSAAASPKVKASNSPSCGSQKNCRQMLTCAQAKHDFIQCGIKSLDGDSDGIPCENLCGNKKKL